MCDYLFAEILHASDECRLGIGLVDLKFDYEKPLIDLQVSTIVYSSQGRSVFCLFVCVKGRF